MIKINFDADICKGCGLCITVCPKNIVVMKEDVINKKGFHPAGVTDEALCSGCASCARICPDCVIRIEKM